MRRKRGLTKAQKHEKDLETLVKLRHIERLTIDQCAERMSVSARTIDYWLASDGYTSKIEELRNTWKEAAITHVAELSAKALETMSRLMSPKTSSEHVQFEAAKAIGDWLGLGLQKEEGVIDDRAELERLLKLQAERPQVVINPIFQAPVEQGGFLPKQLQRQIDVTTLFTPSSDDDQQSGVIDSTLEYR